MTPLDVALVVSHAQWTAENYTSVMIPTPEPASPVMASYSADSKEAAHPCLKASYVAVSKQAARPCLTDHTRGNGRARGKARDIERKFETP